MKLPHAFIQLPVLFDAGRLAAEIEAFGEGAWKPHPQGFAGNSAVPLISAHGDPTNDSTGGPMQPTPWLEKSPYLMQVLATIGATWGRSRLMRLSGHAEVVEHVDSNYYWRERMRVHVPVVTQPTVQFHCGGEQVNMAAGECWIFDTWRLHRVLNDDTRSRIHLVADTVGGEAFWDLVAEGRSPDLPPGPWNPRLVPPRGDERPALEFEAYNLPEVMSPWEIREHTRFILDELGPHPKAEAIRSRMMRFVLDWQALWSAHKEDRVAWPRYRKLIERTRRALNADEVDAIKLSNRVSVMQLISYHMLDIMLADRPRTGGEYREHGNKGDAARPVAAAATAPGPAPVATAGRSGGGFGGGWASPSVSMNVSFGTSPQPVRHVSAPATTPQPSAGPAHDPQFDRPVFIVSSPRSGSTLMFETLARAPGAYTIGGESHALIEGVQGLAPNQRGFDSNRLLATDATPAVTSDLRARFRAALKDRNGAPPSTSRVRMLEKTPKNSLRIPFLAHVFPEARFVYLYRDPRQVLSSMIEAWTTGRFRTYPGLPGWNGPPWSLLLVPGWRELSGKPLAQVVAQQWATATTLMLDDLEQLPAARWSVTRYDAFLDDPQAEVSRICAAVELDWDQRIEDAQSLPLSRYTVSKPDPDKWRRHAGLIEPILERHADVRERAARIAAR